MAGGAQAISCILRPAAEIEIAPPVAGLLEIVTVSTLHAEVVLPDTAYGSVAAQDSVLITANGIQRQGTVDAVDPIIDAASRSFGLLSTTATRH